jgi:hypothetical protein
MADAQAPRISQSPTVTGEYELALDRLKEPRRKLDELTQKIKKKRDTIAPPGGK